MTAYLFCDYFHSISITAVLNIFPQDKADPDPLLSSIESQDTVEDLLVHIIRAGDRETLTSDRAPSAEPVASPNNNSGLMATSSAMFN